MIINLPRRKFLQNLAKGSACLAIFSPATTFAITHRQQSYAEDLLSFTELEGLGPDINAQFIDQGYIALHRERLLPAYLIDADNQSRVEWLLRSMVASQGEEWDESDQLIWTYQYYGFCDHSNQCNKLLDYSLSAEGFLYNTVRGLLDVRVKWKVLTEDFKYTNDDSDDFSGLIGRYTYLVNRVGLVTADGRMKDFGLINASPVNRAINYITSRGNSLNTSLMYIIPGNTSLMSPFSELLHLTTHGPSRRLARQLRKINNRQQAEQTSHIIGETITESAAILMAEQYLNKHRRGDRMNVVNLHAKSLGRQYSLIPETVTYMKLHGVQYTLDQFSENPLHLVKEISHLYKKLIV